SSAINAKFSIPFTTSIAAKYGTVGLEHFTSEFFENKDIISLASKISFEVNHECKKTEALHGRMTLVANGKEYYHEVKNPKGSIENPMTNEEFKQKFISCAKYARKPYSPMEAESIYNKLMKTEEINDLKEVIKLL
ncbi:MAG: MmgE/PrpD family protein, partial [Clostridiales bacterium]|nr:MmgE/PrpD family protein [Clostridiales bacterium]